MTSTRTSFSDLSTGAVIAWYILIAISIAIFVWGVARLVRKYRRGRGVARSQEPFRPRLLRTVRLVATHSLIGRRSGAAGVAHALTFYGFAVLFIGTTILAFQDDFARPALGFDFFRDDFYLGYSLFLDLFGAALTIGLLFFALRRGLFAPRRLRYDRPDGSSGGFDRWRYRLGDWVFLGSLLFLAVSGFLLEALRIAHDDPPFERWSPVGWALGQGFRGLGLVGSPAHTAHFTLWWIHGVVALAFVSAIPFTKALHMLTGPASLMLHQADAGRRLVPIPADAAPDEVGYGFINDLSPRELLQLDACTKCGKCHEACPATASGLPLSPRDIILDLRELAEGSLGIRAQLGVPPLHDHPASVLGDPIRPETLWSCMQCMACVEICPVGIEHVPLITSMRRRLVERGEMDSQLQATLETIYTTGNSFGEPKRKRARWTAELPFEVKDIRKEPAEYLWFVGDYASLDPRNQRVTQALARIFREAGVDFGILFDAERNSGCDVRRVGEEGLFRSLAEENIRNISACSFERIVTWDPHSFHTLRNEYPDLGGSWPVLHHTQLLLELLESGALCPARPSGCVVTYHDPCTLGRYNGVYDAPRQVLGLIGAELREMPRNRGNSFCCGAGGGRIWMKDTTPAGFRRPAEARIDEAVAIGGVDTFVVACPKDVTMYSDAVKTSGHEGSIEVRELSELVLETLAVAVSLAPADAAEDVAGTR